MKLSWKDGYTFHPYILLSSNGDNLNIIYEAIFIEPYSVLSEVTRSSNEDPPLNIAEPELIYRG